MFAMCESCKDDKAALIRGLLLSSDFLFQLNCEEIPSSFCGCLRALVIFSQHWRGLRLCLWRFLGVTKCTASIISLRDVTETFHRGGSSGQTRSKVPLTGLPAADDEASADINIDCCTISKLIVLFVKKYPDRSHSYVPYQYFYPLLQISCSIG